MTADTWVITAGNDGDIRYWSAGGVSLGGATYRQLGLPDNLTGKVCTFATKTAATDAFRVKFGRFPRGHKAVQLTAEQVVLLTPPDDTITRAAGLRIAEAAAAATGLNLVACGQRDDQPTYNLVDSRGKRKRRVHVGLTLDEMLGVLGPAEKAPDVAVSSGIRAVTLSAAGAS